MPAVARFAALFVALLISTAAVAQNKVPTARPLEALVKSSLMTFNDANVTGNYTVLHAKLSKPFREQFPPEQARAELSGISTRSTSTSTWSRP